MKTVLLLKKVSSETVHKSMARGKGGRV